uniref:Uncharacterized protein n=1 Tax=Arundo donax TaxID=35708 RepID=A0A0A9BCA7_ARUDO
MYSEMTSELQPSQIRLDTRLRKMNL